MTFGLLLVYIASVCYVLTVLGCAGWLIYNQLRTAKQERHPALWVSVVMFLLAVCSILQWGIAMQIGPMSQHTYAYLTCFDLIVLLLLPTMGDVLIRRKAAWHKLLFSEMAALTVPVAYFVSEDINIVYYAIWLFLIYYLGMVVWQIHKIRLYDKHLRDEVSDLTGMSKSWFIYVMVLGVGVVVLWALTYVEQFGMRNYHYVLYMVLVGTLSVMVTYFLTGLKLGKIEMNVSVDDEVSFKRIMERNADWDEKLQTLMVVEKKWKNPEIGVEEVAQLMGTNRTYLYRYLREVLGTTFYDMVNRYRLEYAVTLMNDSSNTMSLEQISEKSGFKSIRSFRAVFSEKYECTPGEYVARMKQGQE